LKTRTLKRNHDDYEIIQEKKQKRYNGICLADFSEETGQSVKEAGNPFKWQGEYLEQFFEMFCPSIVCPAMVGDYCPNHLYWQR
jgi:hypothetical protein